MMTVIIKDIFLKNVRVKDHGRNKTFMCKAFCVKVISGIFLSVR